MTSDSTKDPEKQFSSFRQDLPQILAVCVKNVLLLAFGMTLGFPTIITASLSDDDPNEKIYMDQEATSWIGSVNLICVPVGCLVSGSITQALGRKRSMQLVNIPFISAWLLFHFATEKWQIFLALCISGISGGLLEAPVLTYVAEITQPYLRGILSATSTFAVCFGILLEFIIGSLCNWRTTVLVNCAFPVISFILLMLIPETPIWLIANNRLDEAKRSLAWLRGWTSLEHIEPEFQELHKQIKSNAEGSRSSRLDVIKLLAKKNFIWPYLLASFVFLSSSFNGMQPLQTYAVKIFECVKAPINKYSATVLIGIVQLIGCVMCMSLIHRIGKRAITFISVLGAATCFFVTATYLYEEDIRYFSENIKSNNTSDERDDSDWIPLTFLVLSSFFSYLGLRVLPWILIGEVYPNEIRGIGAGISSATAYIFSFISNKIFFKLVSALTLPGVFWFYSACGILSAIILYFALPETEGKTLYEIIEHFSGKTKLRNSVHNKKKNLAGKCNVGFETDEVESKNNSESKM